jgi:glyoxylase-like metal-dependent hydrolase (beta-lactamase superfamily II)
VDDIIAKKRTDKEILVVCAKEGSSIMVAEMLSEVGLTVSYLKGGMKAWSEHLEPVKIGDLKEGGEIYQFVRIGKGCLSYMIVSNGEAAIFDATPGHTIGSTSFVVGEKYLLLGDILSIDSIGRSDLAGKAEDWVGDLRESL